MIIDFHTHAFPDTLAPKAIPKLAESAGITPFHDGTVNGLIGLMDSCGIDKSVVLSIATKPTQENAVNSFAISLLDNPRVIPFGSVYPGSETWLLQLERLKEAGIKGIKLHPEYQSFDIDCDDAIEIYKQCARLSLIVQFHSGRDEAYTTPIHTGAERINKICSLCPETTFIAAHFGGYDTWHEIAQKLEYHDNLYLDSSMTQTCQKIDVADAMCILEKIGTDHVLLGSDSPWEKPCDSVNAIKELDLSTEQKEQILHKNAERLLGL